MAYAYLESGRIMYENGDKLVAIAEYNKAIEIDSNYAVAYYKVSDCSTTSCVFDFLLRCTPL